MVPIRDVVIFPSTKVAFKIGRPSSVRALEEAMTGDRDIFLATQHDATIDEPNAEQIYKIGTLGRILQAQRQDNGQIKVVVEGRERFQILEETEGRSFRTAQVEELVDTGEEPDADEVERCLAAFRRLVETAEAELEESEPGSEGLAYWIASRVDFGVDAKQQLLELLSERERVVRLAELLAQAIGALRFAKTASERAAGNGRVEPPG